MSAAGEADLARLLAAMSPVLAEAEYAFVEHDGGALPRGTFALIREDEGDGIIIERFAAQAVF